MDHKDFILSIALDENFMSPEAAFNAHVLNKEKILEDKLGTLLFCSSIQCQLPATFFCPSSKGETQPNNHL